MTRKQHKHPEKYKKEHLANACTALQEHGQLLRRYRWAFLSQARSRSDDDQAGAYSSPVCYAHLREFREGF